MRIIDIVNKLPILRWRYDVRRLYAIVEQRDATIKDNTRRIMHLERRNDEWAAEVRSLRHENETLHIIWPVDKKDLIDANPLKKAKTTPSTRSKSPAKDRRLAWIIPSVGEVSGGHTTILRLVQYLEGQGYACDLYIYDPQLLSTLERNKENLKHYPLIRGNIYYNQSVQDIYEAAFATSWHTAYPLYNAKITAKKYYFVQDFEPFFDPVGSYSTLAENTYRFGFYGIAMGKWLAQKLSTDYGMESTGFDLGVNPSEYYTKPHNGRSARKKVVFYARPVTPRRGFELGILALEIFAKRHPEYEINLVGWDTSRYDIPFQHVNHGILPVDKLNDLYNECAAGLVLSFTNMSLLPLELYAAGCIPVVNEASHTTSVGYSNLIEYAQPYPEELAIALEKAVKRSAGPLSENELTDNSWDTIFSNIEAVISKQS